MDPSLHRPLQSPRLLRAAATLGLASSLVLASGVAAAQGQIFRCDVGNGPPVYQNAPGKGCKPLDLPPLTSVPGTQPQPAARQQASAPANFPRVGESQQRERDADRRRILEQELNRERARLAE